MLKGVVWYNGRGGNLKRETNGAQMPGDRGVRGRSNTRNARVHAA